MQYLVIVIGAASIGINIIGLQLPFLIALLLVVLCGACWGLLVSQACEGK